MKKLIIGFILGGLLFGSTIGVAATNSSFIEVFYTVKDIRINMQSKMPSDNQPFIYKGTTYVPLRYIAEVFDREVLWDEDSQTIDINSCEYSSSRSQGGITETNDFLCLNGNKVFLPDDVTISGTVVSAEGSDIGRLYLPYIRLVKGKSTMLLGRGGVVVNMSIDPNDNHGQPFQFLDSYITGYLPNAIQILK